MSDKQHTAVQVQAEAKRFGGDVREMLEDYAAILDVTGADAERPLPLCDKCNWSRGDVCGVPYEPRLNSEGQCAWFEPPDAQPVDDGVGKKLAHAAHMTFGSKMVDDGVDLRAELAKALAEVERLEKELAKARAEVERLQSEVDAWKSWHDHEAAKLGTGALPEEENADGNENCG